jgi:hypothetical protein
MTQIHRGSRMHNGELAQGRVESGAGHSIDANALDERWTRVRFHGSRSVEPKAEFLCRYRDLLSRILGIIIRRRWCDTQEPMAMTAEV